MIDRSINYAKGFLFGLLAIQYNAIEYQLIAKDLDTAPVVISQVRAPAEDVVQNYKDLVQQLNREALAAREFEQAVRTPSHEDLTEDQRIKDAEEHKKNLEMAEKAGIGDADETGKPFGEADELAIRMDAQLAAAAIEKETDEVNKEISAEPTKSEREEAKLQHEFNQKQQNLESKLDKNEEIYFKNNPDLSQDERGAAEEKFRKIRDQEVEGLKDKQVEKLAEFQARQEANREGLEKKLQELEDTRAER